MKKVRQVLVSYSSSYENTLPNRSAAPEEVLISRAEELAMEGKIVDCHKLLPPRGFQVLPRRWVVERSFAWICHNRRMS